MGVWGVILCEWDNNKNNYYFLNPHILRKAVPREAEWHKRRSHFLCGEKVRFWEIEAMAFILASSLVSLPVSMLLLCRPFVRGSEFEFVTGSLRGYLDPTSRYARNLSVVSERGCVFRCLYVVTIFFFPFLNIMYGSHGWLFFTCF